MGETSRISIESRSSPVRMRWILGRSPPSTRWRAILLSGHVYRKCSKRYVSPADIAAPPTRLSATCNVNPSRCNRSHSVRIEQPDDHRVPAHTMVIAFYVSHDCLIGSFTRNCPHMSTYSTSPRVSNVSRKIAFRNGSPSDEPCALNAICPLIP